MKRILNFLASVILFMFMLIPSMPVAHALGTNLVTNPSTETADPANSTLPQGWQTGKWGTNTTVFSYATTGHTGSKSVKTTISSYTSGDAKWYFKPVTVTPNTSYTFSDYYQSSIASEIVVQTESTSGTFSYQSLNSPAISSTWKQVSFNYTAPATAKNVTVFHLIKKAGWLQIDDAFFGLTNSTTPTAPTVNITAPVTNATLSNTVNINATASDAVAVVGVQFKVDGVNVGVEDTTAPYTTSWNTSTVTNGTHSLTATARNNQSLSTTSAVVTVNVNNQAPTTPPTVSITAPVANSTVSGTISVNATASDAVAVAGVQFKLDGNNLGSEDTAAPFTTSWDSTTATNAGHALTAVARNSQGLTATSAAVSVTVSNQVTPPPVDQENLVQNPSAETSSNGTQPDKWLSNNWGTNTASFTYDTTGHTGTKSVKTTISSYSSGDAKWYFEPVAITAGKNYLYRDYYKSTVASHIVAAFIDASGNYTYQELGSAAASSSWSLYEATITMPASAVKVTVFHVIESIGNLNLDDALLQVAVPAPKDINVPNGSLETGSTSPTGWTNSSWGTNSTSFAYITNDGHTGTKSVKVTMNSYTDGDAKWYYNPITTLTPGAQYRITLWYKTNVIPKAVAMFLKADGSEQYFGMPNPQPSGSTTTWQKYTETFTVPLDAVSVSTFLFINEKGWLQTDDYSLTTYSPNGFSRPLLTLTFDDGAEENVTSALPLLNSYGFKTTECFATTFIENDPAQAQSNVKAFFNSGHEICSHTVTHPFLTQLTTANLTYELQHSKQYLESVIGQPVVDFASPYGDYNATVNTAIAQYYQSHRTVDEGFNSKDNFDVYRLRVQNILDTTTASQVRAWIEQAKTDNTWLILVYHRVAPDAGPYDTYPDIFAQQLQAIKDSGIVVKTMKDALVEVKAQL